MTDLQLIGAAIPILVRGAANYLRVIVTFALADFVVSAALVAVTVTVAGDGSRLGARYVPPLIVPTVELPPETPFTLQVTAAFEEFVTVAVNCLV